MEMKPYITELTRLIANELDVNTSQVRKLDTEVQKIWLNTGIFNYN